MEIPSLIPPEQFGISIEILSRPESIWIGFCILIGIFALVSMALLYHWTQYKSYSTFRLDVMAILYFTVSLAIIGAIFVSIRSYTGGL